MFIFLQSEYFHFILTLKNIMELTHEECVHFFLSLLLFYIPLEFFFISASADGLLMEFE